MTPSPGGLVAAAREIVAQGDGSAAMRGKTPTALPRSMAAIKAGLQQGQGAIVTRRLTVTSAWFSFAAKP